MTEVKRFYETFYPEHYDIYLDISREKKRFHGKTVVIGEAQEELVKLNQKLLSLLPMVLITVEKLLLLLQPKWLRLSVSECILSASEKWVWLLILSKLQWVLSIMISKSI